MSRTIPSIRPDTNEVLVTAEHVPLVVFISRQPHPSIHEKIRVAPDQSQLSLE